MPSFFRDENQTALCGPEGLRPGGIISATMSGSIQELAIPTAQLTLGAHGIVRIVGTQPVLFSFGAASSPPGTGDVTDMIYQPANVVGYYKVNAADAKVYVKQGGTAGSFQLCWMT